MNPDKSKTVSYAFLPDFCSVYGVFVIILIAQALAFLLELASDYAAGYDWSSLGLRSLFLQWVALTSAGLLCAIKKYTLRLGPRSLSTLVFVTIQAVTLAIGIIVYWGLATQIGLGSNPGPAAQFLFKNFAVSGIISAVLLHYLYVQYQWKQQEQASMEAQLDALQSRIRPHFLFNSLNTIASLTSSDPKLAEELVQDLAELFRASLLQNRSLVTIEEEFSLVKQYLNIELQRLNGRLEIEWKTDQIPADALVPPLSLQPLVENAVYHGIEPAESGGRIYIGGTLSDSTLVLDIENTLPKDQLSRARKGNQMAIENIQARIRGYFPDRGLVKISSRGGIYQVQLVIPYTTTIP